MDFNERTSVKVLVATKRTQGMRDWDMCFALDGELVMRPPGSCDCPNCPCEREMIGLGSRSGTTTFTVADLPHLNLESYRAMLCDELVTCGWVLEKPDEMWLARFIARHLQEAERFEVGAVLEIGGDLTVVQREQPQQQAR